MKQVVSLRGEPQVRLSIVEAHHRALDERTGELGRRPFLSPSEARELAQIKKRKLRAKDEMDALRRAL